METPGEFYEDDEELEDVLAAYAAGEKGVTAPPPQLRSRTVFFDLRGGVEGTEYSTFGDAELVRLR